MELTVSSDFEAQFKKETERILEAVEKGSHDGLDDAAKMALEAKNTEIEKTYDRPERRLKNGRPAYRRSGNWRSSQRIEAPDENTREIVTTGPAADYEAHLAKLPTGPDGVNRSNPADENAFRTVEKRASSIVEDGLNRETERL